MGFFHNDSDKPVPKMSIVFLCYSVDMPSSPELSPIPVERGLDDTESPNPPPALARVLLTPTIEQNLNQLAARVARLEKYVAS